MTSIPKTKAYRNEKYLQFIREKPSLYSGKSGTSADPTVAAHQKFGKGGIAIKPPDTHAVPLLFSEHLVEHLGVKTFWGDQYEALPLRCLEYVTDYLQSIKK